MSQAPAAVSNTPAKQPDLIPQSSPPQPTQPAQSEPVEQVEEDNTYVNAQELQKQSYENTVKQQDDTYMNAQELQQEDTYMNAQEIQRNNYENTAVIQQDIAAEDDDHWETEPEPKPAEVSSKPEVSSPVSPAKSAEASESLYGNIDTIRANEGANGHQSAASAEPQHEEEIVLNPDDPGVTAVALYDYQAAAEDEISFDPDDIITHIEMVGAWPLSNTLRFLHEFHLRCLSTTSLSNDLWPIYTTFTLSCNLILQSSTSHSYLMKICMIFIIIFYQLTDWRRLVERFLS